MFKIATPKKKNNKNDPKQKAIATKQNKLHESSYCETNCKDVGECEKYKAYAYRINVLFKVGYGVLCDK